MQRRARSSLVAVKLVKVVIENHGLYILKVTTQEYRDDQGKKPIDDIVIFRKEHVRRQVKRKSGTLLDGRRKWLHRTKLKNR
ncbi:hypothetical protein KEM48_003106 [Puccinia striiformis f. sp. tritici PST-130]|nr:hypothetical protein KEM48_003106 [Puccinia striiformis f. sp. tritici PST-130]